MIRAGATRVVAACLACGLLAAACSRSREPARDGRVRHDDARPNRLTREARLLAGVADPASTADPVRRADAYRDHARAMAALWDAHNATARRMRPWVDEALAPVQQAPTLFYPFAGADFLYANAFFPRARTYVLVGLERVGDFADLDALPPAQVEREFGRVRKAVAPLLQTTFFKTMEMQADVLQDGILTMLAALVAGTGHRIEAIERVAIERGGRVVLRDAPAGGPTTPGARIVFADAGSDDRRTLYYFRTDLSDAGLSARGDLLAFLDTLPGKVTFTKAAAYCMHARTFSTVRDYVLTRTDAVLEDDTGVPLRYFPRESWDVRFFGRYTHPIAMFQNYRQADLAAAFEKSDQVRPLAFHIGYGTDLASNLLLAVKRRPAKTPAATHASR